MSNSQELYTLEVQGVSKTFGSTLAVNNASFNVHRGELVGIAGHNGAGKSTILKVVNGTYAGDNGIITLNGRERPAATTVRHPELLGVRTVYQELSLAPALRVDETAAVFDRAARGPTWRTRAWRSLETVLDEMFPGHGIRREQKIREISLARRQMIECASAMVDGLVSPVLVILDEPTSSLDSVATASFYAYLRKKASSGMSSIITTHRLQEMIDNLSRIFVMRDGRILGEQSAAGATKESLVAAMGLASHEGDRAKAIDSKGEGAAAGGDFPPRMSEHQPVIATIEQQDERGTTSTFEIHAGEIVGFAGLEGHGQLAMIEALHRGSGSRTGRSGHLRRTRYQSVRVIGPSAYVSGDRTVRGLFPLWDVTKNVSYSTLKQLTTGFLIRPIAEMQLVDDWYRRLAIKGLTSDPITALSGGTQQKALMARAMAVGASLLLLEDPTRGVDQATKAEVVALLRAQAGGGCCVVWYSTENEELRQCDRVFVFRAGRIVAELRGAETTEDALIAHSFAGGSEQERVTASPFAADEKGQL